MPAPANFTQPYQGNDRPLRPVGVLRRHRRDGAPDSRSKARRGVLVSVVPARRARARRDIARGATDDGGCEVYTTGRVGAFVEVLRGEPSRSRTDRDHDRAHAIPQSRSHRRRRRRHPSRPDRSGAESATDRPGRAPVVASRVRSGFLPNILAFGLRRQVTERTRSRGSSRSGRDRDDQPADVPRQQPRRARGIRQRSRARPAACSRARALAVLARRRRDRLPLRSRLRPSATRPASTSRDRRPATSATASSPRCSWPASSTPRRSFTAFS